MKTVYCIGEMLIDFISKEKTNDLENSKTFLKNAGGAPANVSIAISKLGGKASFIGQVGDDGFGRYLKKVLLENDVEIKYLKEEGKTSLAFVTLDEDGERDFYFSKGDDVVYDLKLEEFNHNDIAIVHFGAAMGLINKTVKDNYMKILKYAKEKNLYISFDPNYREALIDNKGLEDFKEDCWTFIRSANLVKLSTEEAMLITETNTIEDSMEVLFKENIDTLVVTMGSQGAMLVKNNQISKINSIDVKQVDSTGAGDAFIGGILYKLSLVNYDLCLIEWKEVIKFANMVGAITTTKYGAINASPTTEEILVFSKE